jgi:hypothetical protein
MRPVVQLRLPGQANPFISSTRYAQPRDANQLEDTYTLNLTGGWDFPIASRVSGNLKLEVANVTDEQEQIAVNLATGQPIRVRQSYQKPREMRVLAGVRF